jgi:hypothetical protein
MRRVWLGIALCAAAGCMAFEVDGQSASAAQQPQRKSAWWQTPAPPVSKGQASRETAGPAATQRARQAEKDSNDLAIEPLRWPAREATPAGTSPWVIQLSPEG